MTSEEDYAWRKVAQSWSMVPCEHFLARIQYMDAQGSALLDINYDASDPMGEMHRSFASMLDSDVSVGPLRAVFFHFEIAGIETIHKISDEVRHNIVCVDCQVWFWLGPLKDFPFKWVGTQDPHNSTEEQEAIYEERFNQFHCCKDEGFDRKLVRIYPTFEELRICKCFSKCVSKMGRQAKVLSMELERLLAQISKASPEKLPHAERLCAQGLMCQWLRPHLQQGGRDPRVISTDTLVEDGVPIERNRHHGATGARGLAPSMLYSNEKLAEAKETRKSQGLPAFSRSEIQNLTKQCNTDFRNLDQTQQQVYIDLSTEQRIAAGEANPTPGEYDSSRR